MIIEEVKQIIANSKFNPALKQRLVVILPRLGKYTLSGLGKEVSRSDSLIVADYLVSLWEKFANLLDTLKNKDVASIQNLSAFLTENLSLFNGEDEFYFLNFVLDVRVLAGNSQLNISSNLYEKMLDFELGLFWSLPKQEVIFLLQNHLLFLESRVDLLEHMKAITWDNKWDYTKDFTKIFSEVLLSNKELLAEKPVGDWIHEYFDFSSAAAFRKDVVQVVEFMVKNPAVQKLNAADKKTLSDILKLYVWFLGSEINEAEVVAYKEKIRDTEAQRINQQLLKTYGSSFAQTQKPQAPVIPAPKNAPSLRPMGEIQKSALPQKEKAFGNLSEQEAAKVLAQSLSANRPQAVPPVRPVNIQDILNSKLSREDDAHTPGLKMGEMQFKSPSPQADMKQEAPNNNTPDIDKKLEELKKKLKT